MPLRHGQVGSRVSERGHRLGLVIEAQDRADPTRFLHQEPADRVHRHDTVHTCGDMRSYLLVPVIPAQEQAVATG